MDGSHFSGLPIYKQQVLFISFHFHVLDAPALEKVIRETQKYWDENYDSDSISNSDTDW